MTWVSLKSEKKNTYYVFKPIDDPCLIEGGSSKIFKGFCYNSLKDAIPRGISFQELHNSLIKNGKLSSGIRRILENHSGKKKSDRELLFSLPLKFVAIKVLKRNLHNKVMRALWDKEASFNITHPNLIEVLDAIDTMINGRKASHLISEWIDGVTLDKVFSPKSNVDLSTQKIIFNQVFDGVEAIHNTSQIHRDLKPYNIMVDKKMNVKVLDYALLLDLNNKTNREKYWGTENYSAPEHLREERLGYYTDIWSIGIIMYEALFKKRPFKSDKLEVLNKRKTTIKESLGTGTMDSNDIDQLKNDLDEVQSELQEELYDLIFNEDPSYAPLDFHKEQLDLFKVQTDAIKGCLEKNRKSRFNSIEDLRIEFNKSTEKPASSSFFKEFWLHILLIIMLICSAVLLMLSKQFG